MILRSLPVVLCLALPIGVAGQVATVGPDAPVEETPNDPDDVRGEARDAQAAFERTRLRYSPIGYGGGGGSCDERVGRFCTTYQEGEWYPREEAEEIVEARAELLAELDSLQRLAPEDGWILGQRVWYRGEGGDWSGALSVARACAAEEGWWCWALQGLALHASGRFEASRAVFDIALDEMDPEVALEWRVPERAVDRDARGRLRDWQEQGAAALDAGLAWFWALSDPLFLVDGNDRLTAHYARWTVSEIRRDAKNPYGLGWSSDLEELTVRHGWELGYDRIRRTIGMQRDGATGHKHPEGRDFLPHGDVLRDPTATEAEDLIAQRVRPRSLYAPPYAPLLLPIESELTILPRGDSALIVASAYLPGDTSFHAGHDHPKPWLEAGDQADMPDRMGLFALPVGAAAPTVGRTAEGSEGALLIEVPVGTYVLSVESWSPSRRMAGRYRVGLEIAPVTPDVPTLSDLLLFRSTTPPPTSVEEALPRSLGRARVSPGDPVSIAWEITGLGFRTETLDYDVSVDRTDRGFFHRVGELFGLADRPRPLALAWQEPAPDRPGPQFRHLDLELPPLDPGTYQITLTLHTRGRSDVASVRTFEVTDPD